MTFDEYKQGYPLVARYVGSKMANTGLRGHRYTDVKHDATTEALSHLYARWPREEDSFAEWLLTHRRLAHSVVRNVVVDAQRHDSVRRVHRERVPSRPVVDVYDHTIEELPADLQQVAQMLIDGYSMREVSRAIGCSRRQVTNTVDRLRYILLQSSSLRSKPRTPPKAQESS